MGKLEKELLKTYYHARKALVGMIPDPQFNEQYGWQKYEAIPFAFDNDYIDSDEELH